MEVTHACLPPYTLKKFLKAAENYLIVKENMINKKYTSPIRKNNMQCWIKNYYFQKNDSVSLGGSLHQLHVSARYFCCMHLLQKVGPVSKVYLKPFFFKLTL